MVGITLDRAVRKPFYRACRLVIAAADRRLRNLFQPLFLPTQPSGMERPPRRNRRF
jgi:hypothetical protein